jgi:hypothetical protein
MRYLPEKGVLYMKPTSLLLKRELNPVTGKQIKEIRTQTNR